MAPTTKNSIKCPKCAATTRVMTVNRDYEMNIVIRYRKCENETCKHKFITNQILIPPPQFQEKIVESRKYDNRALTEDQVREIRSLYGSDISIRAIARNYGVCDKTIVSIMKYLSYKSVV